MAIRLIRQESETPNVSNHDDTRMVRYAYGGYDGFIKDRGLEIGHAVNGTSFVVQSGVINLQGWEVEVDANGVSISTSASVANKLYYSVYLEVNCATETAEIKSVTDHAGFPDIPASDDLTANTIGTARLLLYHFTATGGIIADVEKMVNAIEYAENVAKNLQTDLKEYVNDSVGELQEGLQEGEIIPDNAKKVNGIAFTRGSGENGVLKIGDIVIPQKKLIWSGRAKGPARVYFSEDIQNNDIVEAHFMFDAQGGPDGYTIHGICRMKLGIGRMADAVYVTYVTVAPTPNQAATQRIDTNELLGAAFNLYDDYLTIGGVIKGTGALTERVESVYLTRVYKIIE